ncbi:MAG: polysaccharide biosynthesis/export family protein [Chitinophagales bacterium]|nr:polysaccharide biosynthesis/export family protein [Chitinophagales bacterium]MDW8394139.1 polysaccharide biosynthesis/export family protein [Chitinophagales bacterium]
MKTDKDLLARADTLKTQQEYVLRPGDEVTLGVYANNGYELVDVLRQGGVGTTVLRYQIRQNGYAHLPMLDSVLLGGMTIYAAEQLLAQRYSYYFVNPFVRLEVSNRNIMVFRGRYGAQVVLMQRDDMNLLEIIALAGGIPEGGKAYRVRVLRGSLDNPTVFDVDLSTVEGIRSANLKMQADDVVYIETRVSAAEVLNRNLSFLTLISTALFIYTVVAK